MTAEFTSGCPSSSSLESSDSQGVSCLGSVAAKASFALLFQNFASVQVTHWLLERIDIPCGIAGCLLTKKRVRNGVLFAFLVIQLTFSWSMYGNYTVGADQKKPKRM